MERESHSGIVSWTDSQIEWQNPNGPDVVVHLNDVVVIGEYTTDAGSHFDDWFLIFVYRTGEWESIPVYADGMDDLKRHLSELYRTDLSKYFLTNSTEWKSYIRYPQDLEGTPLFVMSAPAGYEYPKSFFRKIQAAIGLGVYGRCWDFDLTEEVKNRLTNAR